MSLFKQIWLTFIATTCLTFSGAFFVSTLSTRDYLEEQLRIKNADNAISIALSIAPFKKDTESIDLQLTAIFDTGQYALIRVRDPEGKILIEKEASLDEAVPQWFVQLLPIESPAGLAQIAAGWNQLGSLELISHTHFAYRELWASAQRQLLWFLIGGVAIALLGVVILLRVRRPLDAVVKQAKAISQRNFIEIAVPSTTELQNLALAMNTMVQRLKHMFEDEARRVEALRREAALDEVTQLYNRRHFMNQLDGQLSATEEPAQGSLVILHLADLSGINQRHGREHADQVLRQLALTLKQLADAHPLATAARLNGSDFALLLPGEASPEASSQRLLACLRKLAGNGMIQARQIGYIGNARYQPGETRASLLSRIDAAIAAAENDGDIACRSAEEEATPRPSNNADWRKQLEHGLTHQALALAESPVIDNDGRLLHLDCPLRLQVDTSGQWLDADSFIPVARRLGMIGDFDLAAIKLALARLKLGAPAVAVHLAGESISDIVFCQQLSALIAHHRELAPRLWLDVTESSAFRYFEALAAFAQQIRPLGCRMGIEHFGRQLGKIHQLHEIGLDYLKVDDSFIRGIDRQPNDQNFLKGLCGIAHKIGLTVIAEGVSSAAELALLPTLGFDAATGPAVFHDAP